LRQVRYLSAEWIDAASAAIAADDALPAALAGVTLTVEQTVTDAPGGSPGPGDPALPGGPGRPGGIVTWHISIDDGKVALTPGPAPRPDLRFTTSYDTAARVAAGRLPAQRAFVEGRLRVGGDLSLLVTHMRAIAAVDDALAPVRARTTYDDHRPPGPPAG
jgi:SCP-2 sterol transfer family